MVVENAPSTNSSWGKSWLKESTLCFAAYNGPVSDRRSFAVKMALHPDRVVDTDSMNFQVAQRRILDQAIFYQNHLKKLQIPRYMVLGARRLHGEV